MVMQKLSPRLLAAANFVRPSSFIADVGTDHAYLPIHLCQLGKIKGAVASDINEGPVARATINVGSNKLNKKISVVLANGLCGIEKYNPDDIIICGMGGELIISILENSKWVKDSKKRLILQPMTHSEKLRKYLLSQGFEIFGEALPKEDRVYQVICAGYTGKISKYSDIELILGRKNIENKSENLCAYAEYIKNVYSVRYNGKKSSGADASYEEKIIREIDTVLKIFH